MSSQSNIAPPAEAGGARLIDQSFTLPTPMLGETVRSFWERFHRLAPMATTKETLAALFGEGASPRFGHRLPQRITKLARSVGSNHPLGDVRTIVEKHSMLPYSCFFHTPSQTQQAYTALAQHRGAAAARAVIGDAIRDVRAERPWPAFCPKCAKADMEYGFTYWRVVHQLRTVVVCPEHGCRLREKRPNGKALDITLLSDFPPPDLLREDENDFPLVTVDPRIDGPVLLKFATASAYMLVRPTGFRGDFRSGMMLVLREMGLRSCNGINHAAVRTLLIETHGAPLLEWLGMGEVLKPSGAKAIRRMLGFRRERTDTERYLALALALKPDLSSLETAIEALRAHPGAHTNEFMPSWVRELPALRESGYSVDELAARYKVTKMAVRRHLLRIGETLDGRSQPLSSERSQSFFVAARQGLTSTVLRRRFNVSKYAVPLLLEQDPVAQSVVERADFAALRDVHRARALATLERHPRITSEELAKKLSRVHTLLRRYDLQWARRHLPQPTSLGRWSSKATTAAEADARLSEQVAATIHVLREDEPSRNLALELGDDQRRALGLLQFNDEFVANRQLGNHRCLGRTQLCIDNQFLAADLVDFEYVVGTTARSARHATPPVQLCGRCFPVLCERLPVYWRSQGR